MENSIGTTVPSQISYQLSKSYVCCLDIHFFCLSYLYLLLFQVPALDACYLGFTLVTSGYVQHFRCQKEVWFPFDIPMVLFACFTALDSLYFYIWLSQYEVVLYQLVLFLSNSITWSLLHTLYATLFDKVYSHDPGRYA